MNFFGLFGNRSAPVARERLKILLAHERAAANGPNLISVLQEEILAVVARHIAINPDMVQLKLTKGKAASTLKIDIALPGHPAVRM
jgi:cell division topological specificity factor